MTALALLLAGRSLRSTVAELVRRLVLVGWLHAPIRHRRLRHFHRAWFTVRRWHLILSALLGAKLLHSAYRLALSLTRHSEVRLSTRPPTRLRTTLAPPPPVAACRCAVLCRCGQLYAG